MDESISVSWNEAVEVGEEDDNADDEDENAVCDSLPGFDVSQMEESFMSLESLDAPGSPSSSGGQTEKDTIEYLKKIRSNQKQRLLGRNRRIMELKKENRNLKKVV